MFSKDVSTPPCSTQHISRNRSCPSTGRWTTAIILLGHPPCAINTTRRCLLDTTSWRVTERTHLLRESCALPRMRMLTSMLSLHPYRYEIKHLSYPARMFTSSPPVPPKSFEETPFTWVSTPEDLATMLDKLRAAKEIAVDLEYHNYRSFGGFVCLMQISSRDEDFVVDTLALREELEELNEVFTNPNIVKVYGHPS